MKAVNNQIWFPPDLIFLALTAYTILQIAALDKPNRLFVRLFSLERLDLGSFSTLLCVIRTLFDRLLPYRHLLDTLV